MSSGEPTPLQRRVIALNRAGTLVPCQRTGSEMWLSERADDRAEAAEVCRWCPVLDECREAADMLGEAWGVWGGRDRSPGKRGRPPNAVTA